ncbi:phosphopantetheine-binding protein [Amycolatopsis sp. NBC_00345]|uniref:phosphopantetheine-binding protein n=1 Tax=Amycolatopsis sp. NBC_00345 TaxID=2975955 RepID=UPI002E261DEF
MDDAVLEKVIRRHLKNLPEDQELAPEASLKELGLDSMKAVELLFDLEDELGIALPDNAMTRETFATPASLKQVLLDAAAVS